MLPEPAPMTEVLDTLALDAAGFQALMGVSDAQLADLARYQTLLAEWNAVMNLVGPATLPDFWNRHAWDSAQLLRLAPDALTWADLGAGAGLPGLVLAILGKGVVGFHVDLVESMAKRCRFLADVVAELDLPQAAINAEFKTRACSLLAPWEVPRRWVGTKISE